MKERKLTLLPPRLHASHIARPGNEKARQMTERSGRRLLNSYKHYPHHQPGSALRMFVDLLVSKGEWHSTKCLLTWKILDTKSSRLLFQLAPSTPRTDGIESGLLPTTRAQEPGRTSEGYGACLNDVLQGRKGMLPTPDASDRRSAKSKQQGVSNVVAMLPTPATRDYKGASGKTYAERGGGKKGEALPASLAHGTNPGLKLHPDFVSFMMGFPIDWMDVE